MPREISPSWAGLPTRSLQDSVVKAAGARVVTLGTADDQARLDMARTLGADEALNVQGTDAKAAIHEMTAGLGANVIFECSGAEPSAQNCLDLVRRSGALVDAVSSFFHGQQPSLAWLQ